MEDTQDLNARVTMLQENVLRWEDRLQSESAGPAAFRQAVRELRDALDDIGRAGFQRLAQACELGDDTLVADGRVCRFKQVVGKEWMTLWGKVVIPRRLYQADRDFYHAAQHLSMAAEHLFGKSTVKADRWYRSWRHKLRHDPGAVDALIRSLYYHRRKLCKRTERYRLATVELGYFHNNRDKMDYASYHASGLIISSGPVEAAAKTIVGHRLKRSGMRWTRQGGQQILNLRVLVQSKRWDAFWNWYLQQTTPIETERLAA